LIQVEQGMLTPKTERDMVCVCHMLELDSCNHVHGKQTYMSIIVGLKQKGHEQVIQVEQGMLTPKIERDMVSYARIRQLQPCPWQTNLHVHYCGSQTEGPSIGDPSRVQFPDNGEPRTYITQQFACTSLVPVASSWCQATTIVEIPPQKFQNTSIDQTPRARIDTPPQYKQGACLIMALTF
jgi:hypothetical protein